MPSSLSKTSTFVDILVESVNFPMTVSPPNNLIAIYIYRLKKESVRRSFSFCINNLIFRVTYRSVSWLFFLSFLPPSSKMLVKLFWRCNSLMCRIKYVEKICRNFVEKIHENSQKRDIYEKNINYLVYLFIYLLLIQLLPGRSSENVIFIGLEFHDSWPIFSGRLL